MNTAARPVSLIRKLTRQLLILGAAMIMLQFALVVADYALEDEKMSVLMAQHEAGAIADGLVARDGLTTLKLSPSAEERYRVFSHDYAFRVLAEDGKVLAERNPDLIDAVPTIRTGLPRFLTVERRINGILTRVSIESFDTDAGTIWVAVAIRRDPASLYRKVLLHEAMSHVAEPMLPLLILTLLVSIYTVRRGLRPLTVAARSAATLPPDATSLRIPEENLPAEVSDLVHAINTALERMHLVFASQREFLAIAAHELRTPLAILTLQLGRLSGPEAALLRRDVEQMTRLVNQLVTVARLEGSAPAPMSSVDLAAIARGVIERLLPLALSQRRTIAFEDGGAPPVTGNADMLSDALRNLLDNALRYAPEDSTVRVRVGPGASITVEDEGPGVPAADRARIFERFYRRSTADGSGLGLFIVRRIANSHQAQITLGESPRGGACFTLTFPVQAPSIT